MFDVLTHLHLCRAHGDAMLKRAAAVGVTDVLEAGTTPSDAPFAPDEQTAGRSGVRIHIARGVHPMFIEGDGRTQLAQLARDLDTMSVAALGEIGLDYRQHAPPREVQQVVFEAQLRIARERGLPIVLHAVRANVDTLALLKAYAPVRGVAHAFTGSIGTGRALLERGLLLSIGPRVLHERGRKLHAALATLRRDDLVLETDAPEHRQGGRAYGEPADLEVIAHAVAQHLGDDVAAVKAHTAQSARALFVP